MRFSWKAILLAPLPVPLNAGLVLAMAPSQSRLFSFLFFFAVGCVFSYGVTVVLFLPCLFVLSRFTGLTVWLTGLLGLVLGTVVYFHVDWQSYLDICGATHGRKAGCFTWEDS